MQVILWPVEKCVSYSRSLQKDHQAVDRMAASSKEYGFKIPVLACGQIVDGHLRLKAAQKLGMDEVPVILSVNPILIRVVGRVLRSHFFVWPEPATIKTRNRPTPSLFPRPVSNFPRVPRILPAFPRLAPTLCRGPKLDSRWRKPCLKKTRKQTKR